MNESFIRDRISVLRTKNNISEYKMSIDLGHSNSYIHSISSGKALPSMGEFLCICDYLGVTPKEFFDEETAEPQLAHRLYQLAKSMTAEDLQVLILTAERLTATK